MLSLGKLPIFRTQEVDDRIELTYIPPEGMGDEEFTKKWLPEHGVGIAAKWLEDYKDFK